jgi:hypothetical protein
LNDLVSFDYEKEFQSILNKRKVGYLEWGSTDSNGKYYCRVNVEGQSVFCHSSHFIEAVDENSLHKGCPVYLDVFTNEKGPYGATISFLSASPHSFRRRHRIPSIGSCPEPLNMLKKGSSASVSRINHLESRSLAFRARCARPF